MDSSSHTSPVDSSIVMKNYGVALSERAAETAFTSDEWIR
jgi:hypothetical protein